MDIQSKNDLIDLLPVSFFHKDLSGVYLSGNNYLKNKMESIGVKMSSLIGRSDFSVFSKNIANTIRDHDREAMESKKGIVKYEKIILNQDKKLKEIIFLSAKKPVLNQANNKVCGIIGISIDITENYQTLNTSMPVMDLLLVLENKAFPARKIFELSARGRGAQITFRQAQCAYLLCLGKTTKEIGAILGISNRTVEDHIQQLKTKFNCVKKSCLIECLLAEIGVSNLANFITQYQA